MLRELPHVTVKLWSARQSRSQTNAATHENAHGAQTEDEQLAYCVRTHGKRHATTGPLPPRAITTYWSCSASDRFVPSSDRFSSGGEISFFNQGPHICSVDLLVLFRAA